MEQDFADRTGTALVVGGSGGIGRAIVRMLAERGSDVVATYRASPDRAAAAVVEATAYGVRAEAVAMDLADAEGCAGTVAQVAASYGGLHTVVYAAGPHVPMRHLSRVHPDELARQLDTDAAAFFRVVAPARRCARRAATSSQ
jgi:3-oxoacyl-[acyl-carrier protein] reductase